MYKNHVAHGSTHDGLSGGILYLMSPELARFYPAPRLDPVVLGRIGILRLRACGCPPLDVVNLHLIDTPTLPLHVQLMQLRRCLSPLAFAHTIMTGDMNLVAAGEGRLDVATGAMRPERHDRAGFMEDRFAEFAEVVADGYSRRQFRGGSLDVLSRIDRVMINSLTTDLDSVRASARYVTPLSDVTLPSDHTALGLLLSSPPRGTRRRYRGGFSTTLCLQHFVMRLFRSSTWTCTSHSNLCFG